MKKPTTEQDRKIINNPTGKGGFQEHPELINAGGRPKNPESISYWMREKLKMRTSEFKKEASKGGKSEDEKTVAEDIAIGAVIRASKSVRDLSELVDRTEGKAPQTIKNEFTGDLSLDVPEEVLNVFKDAVKLALRRKPLSKSDKREPTNMDDTKV